MKVRSGAQRKPLYGRWEFKQSGKHWHFTPSKHWEATESSAEKSKADYDENRRRLRRTQQGALAVRKSFDAK
jgi:hypothetical protein